MKRFVEIRKGDVILFNQESGRGSFVNIKNKGIYFMPAKKQTRLDGQKLPIKKNEPFIFLGSEILNVSGSYRMLKVMLTRMKTNQTCFITEYHLHQYFSKPENHIPYVENY
tara:strand:- start:287 stop:619 length:333 start_codon:yes stop_codon:yes gene_type:complete